MKNSWFFLALCGMFAIYGCSKNWADVQVENSSGLKVKKLDVVLGTVEKTEANLPPNEKVDFRFRITTDAHYVVNAELEDGKVLKGGVGYVTPGMDSRDVIVITRKGVELKTPK